jgi:hypothetical protein
LRQQSSQRTCALSNAIRKYTPNENPKKSKAAIAIIRRLKNFRFDTSEKMLFSSIVWRKI